MRAEGRGQRAERILPRLLLFFVLFLPFALCPLPSHAAPKSPYLAQHASDPVQWREYSEAAFAQAKKDNKLIFLSVGYSTCHWCHEMQRESFADPEIAKSMNEAFVNILVDREERPDVDSVYLAVTRTLTGDAGWPNNVILTPDGKPFFAAAYIPKERFRALIPRVQTMWRDQREGVVASADMVMKALDPPPVSPDTLGADTLEKGYRQLAARYDAANGGFLPPPKFPSPHHLMFLLRYWKRTGDAKALEMVENTLTQLRARPIYDAQRFGFHRYASDAAWREPHYEKMLSDQAVLAIAYLEAWQATHKKQYADVAREIFTYVLRDLKAPNGAFFTAHDSEDRSRRDEKILTDWNGLMIAALAFGSAVLDEPSYAKAATRAAGAVWTNPRKFLDDYAFFVWGLLNLYEATFDSKDLERAIALEDEALRLFRDKDGRFYVTSTNELLVRPRESGDGALPSGNSVQLMNLARLAHITARDDYRKDADALIRSVADEASLAPVASTYLLSALDFVLGPSYEVVLAGNDVSSLRRAVFANFVPNKVVLGPTKLAPFTEMQKPIGRRATAYICTNYLCKLPTTDAAKVAALLKDQPHHPPPAAVDQR